MEHHKKPEKKEKKPTDDEVKQADLGGYTVLRSIKDLSRPKGKPPFKLADDFFNTSFVVPFKEVEAMIHLRAFLAALKYSNRIEKVQFNSYSWTQEEINSLVDALSSNTSVNEIEFYQFGFSTMFMEGFVKILKKNTHIKHLRLNQTPMAISTWTRFCDGLEYYHFSTLSTNYCRLDEPRMEALGKYMNYNQSIKIISLDTEPMVGRSFDLFCKILAKQHSLEKLELIRGLDGRGNIECLNDVLAANTLKSLILQVPYAYDRHLGRIIQGLVNNTSITELSIPNQHLKQEDITDLLMHNRGIKQLDLSNIEPLHSLDLGDNTTLTDLNINRCHNLPLSSIVTALSHNRTLKKLSLGNNGIDDIHLFEKFLASGTALQELYFGEVHRHQVPLYANALANALKVNKTIRKIVIDLTGLSFSEMQPFIESLKENSTLTALNMGPYERLATSLSTSGIELDDIIIGMLKTNRSLRTIEGINHFLPLKRNRETQDQVISDTRLFIRMILKKPNSFSLPMEVWLRVFKYFSYSFSSFDFENFFEALLSNESGSTL